MNATEELKREVFGRIMELVGRVFIVIRHSERVHIGRRGFTDEEKVEGLVLVFNAKMTYIWGDDGIEGTLSFGGKAEQIFIPSEDIMLVYSPELGVQLHVSPVKSEVEGAAVTAKPKQAEAVDRDAKVIKVDFSKGK